jgi:hypothetical protein
MRDRFVEWWDSWIGSSDCDHGINEMHARAAWNAAILAACNQSANFSVRPGASIYPGLPWDGMNESSKTAAHTTAQQIAMEIAAMKTPPKTNSCGEKT